MPLSSAECARLHRCLLCLSVRRTTMKRPRWTFFMKRRMIFCRPLVLIILMLSLGGLGIQMLTVHGDIEHLATCFGPRNATFTVVTIGENINPSIAENLIENKLSWAKRHQAQLCWYFARMDRSRSTSWNKILAFHRLLQKKVPIFSLSMLMRLFEMHGSPQMKFLKSWRSI